MPIAQCCQVCCFSAKFGYFFIWLAGKICFCRVADFLSIFKIFWLKIWRIFVQDLDQCLVHKKAVKIHLIFYRVAKLIVSECVRSFVSLPAASVHRKPCVWLGFSDQIVPRQVDVADVCWTALNLPTERIDVVESRKLPKYWYDSSREHGHRRSY